MSLPFLLEIGTEEIPDWMIAPALSDLQSKFQAVLGESRLGGRVDRVDATPRRLVLWAVDIRDSQDHTEELVMGPPKSAGPGAASGFARKLGVTAEQLSVESTPKGEYFSYKKQIRGESASTVLARALPDVISKIYFPKTMVWRGKGTERFIRPVRWVVALLGDGVVPFQFAGIPSGNQSRGHRLLGKAEFPVSIENYERELETNGVIISAAKRRARIESEIQGLLSGDSLRLRPDPKLLDTLVYLTEYPAAVLGHFDAQYLSLPSEVLVTVMRHHQKYFSVETAGGSLAPHFIAVMNTNADPEGLVRQGNERVLRARFNDARFFWEADQKRRIEERLEDLKHVTFQAKLGSYYDKTQRMVELTGQLGGDAQAQRAALLSKCDLTTEMVKEFTDLQGIVGGLYARAQGEPEAVSRAIYEHYKPLSMEDSIPSTEAGRAVALADKLDTLRECFRVGLIPTGSKDPFALRRAAQGVVKIVTEAGLPLRIESFTTPELREFLLDRIEYYFREVRGRRYDEVRAVLKAGWDNLPDVQARLEALAAVRPTANFEPLAASFKRIQNILKQAQFTVPNGAVNPALLEAGPEQDLYSAIEHTRNAIRGAAYGPALESIAALRPKVDLFFDKVLVNAKDEAVRRNRLTLLHNLLTEFSTIADFSEIVTER